MERADLMEETVREVGLLLARSTRVLWNILAMFGKKLNVLE